MAINKPQLKQNGETDWKKQRVSFNMVKSAESRQNCRQLELILHLLLYKIVVWMRVHLQQNNFDFQCIFRWFVDSMNERMKMGIRSERANFHVQLPSRQKWFWALGRSWFYDFFFVVAASILVGWMAQKKTRNTNRLSVGVRIWVVNVYFVWVCVCAHCALNLIHKWIVWTLNTFDHAAGQRKMNA